MFNSSVTISKDETYSLNYAWSQNMHPGWNIPIVPKSMVQMTTTILNDFAKTIMSVFDEQLNGEILHSYIVKFYYHMENLFIPVINLLNLQVCVNVLTKVSDFPNRSCVLNFCTK